MGHWLELLIALPAINGESISSCCVTNKQAEVNGTTYSLKSGGQGWEDGLEKVVKDDLKKGLRMTRDVLWFWESGRSSLRRSLDRWDYV